MASARRKRPRPKLVEIAAAVAVVVAGVGLIAAIVLFDPRWQRLIASHRDAIAVGPPEAVAPAAPEAQAVPGASATPQAPASRGAAPPAPMRPAHAESTPVAISVPPPRPSDTAQVMASLLISQLGLDLAWRTAIANADGQAADTPEHTYWREVATAIREGPRPRP